MQRLAQYRKIKQLIADRKMCDLKSGKEVAYSLPSRAVPRNGDLPAAR